MKTSKYLQSHVKFTADEYEAIKEDALLYKKSIPEMLKAIYFGQKIARPLMAPEDGQRVLVELSRVGNNLNQIARHMNTGFRKDFNPAIDEMRDQLQEMRDLLAGKHGNYQN